MFGRGRGRGRRSAPSGARGSAPDIARRIRALTPDDGVQPVGFEVILGNALLFSFLNLFLSSQFLYSVYLPTLLMSFTGYELLGSKIVYVHAFLHIIAGYGMLQSFPWIIQSAGMIFILSSMYFRFYPTQVLSKSLDIPPSAKPQVIGHRIGCGEGIENTIETYQAVKDVVWGLQIDVMETKDGVVVLFHDDPKEKNLERLTGVDGEVKDYNLADLPKYKDEVPPIILCDKDQTPFDGKDKAIDTFGTILKSIDNEEKSPFLIVEMWDESESLVKETYDLLEKSGRVDRLVWGSPFSEKIGAYCEQTSPKTWRMATAKEWIILRLLHYFYLLPFYSVRENMIFNIPVFTARFRNLISKVCKDSWIIMAFIYPICEWFFTSYTLLDHLQRRNVPVFLHICNCEAGFKLAKRFNADAIMTDYPHRLRSYLESSAATELLGKYKA